MFMEVDMAKKVVCDIGADGIMYCIPKEEEENLHEDEYTSIGKENHCLCCGTEFCIGDVLDYNLNGLENVYRDDNEIVSLELIRDIPKKYMIGKRPLSRLLGWGEQTFSRYYDGDIPSKQYSDVLYKIYKEPAYYLEVLEKNKDKLKTKSSYRKSKEAVERLLGKGANRKIQLVTEYIINKCQDITPLAVQKALYYVQGIYYSFYGEYIFREDCVAGAYGPVYPEVYKKYRYHRFYPSESRCIFNDSLLSTREKVVLDTVIKSVCCYSGNVLKDITCLEAPWILERDGLSTVADSDRIIEKESIGEYFKNVKATYNMLTPLDFRDYMKDMFNKVD